MSGLPSIENYRIERVLGEGGMGSVYLATDVGLRRQVALKVMHSQYARDPQFQERFLQEARAAARLDHPSIVRIYHSGTFQGQLFLAMEYVAGGTLSAQLRAAQVIDLREALALLAQVADALDYAHRQGIIHRDIKPANILLKPLDKPDRPGDPPLRAVVSDFGLAKLMEGGIHTQSGTFLGTLPYMSPEQCLGQALDGRSDIYSLGVVLYQIACGQMPLDIKTPTDAVMKHMKEVPPAPSAVRPGVPAEVEAAIQKAIAKQPQQRYATAGEMAEALRQAASGVTREIVATLAPGQAVVSLVTRLAGAPEAGAVLPTAFGAPPAPGLVGDRIEVAARGQPSRIVEIRPGAITIGRAPDSTIVLNVPGVSRRHARIEFDGTAYLVIDLGSTNGTYLGDSMLLPNVPQAWSADQMLRIGEYWLRLQRGERPPQPSLVRADGSLVAAEQVRTSPGEARLAITMEPAELAVEPGASASASVLVMNQGPIVDHFAVSVVGIPPDWVSLLPQPFRLLPGEQQATTLSIRPPRSPQGRAGRYPLGVRVSSQSAPDQAAEVKSTLTVGTYVLFNSSLQPERIRARSRAQVRIENQGNAPQTFSLSWQDRSAELLFEPPHAQLNVAEGQAAAAEFRAGPRRQRWIGGEKVHPFTAQVCLGDTPPRSHNGEIVSRGRIPAWLIPVVILPLAAACVVLAITLYPRIFPKHVEPTDTPTVEPGAPVIGEFSVYPTQVTPGGTVSLRWSVSDAESVTLQPFGTVDSAGTMEDTPQQTRMYTLVATNRGKTVQRAQEVQVVTPVPGSPVVNSFSVEPSTITAGGGGTVRLTWDTDGADTVTIEPGLGPVGLSGSRDIPAPANTTVYTLAARGPGGETESTVRLEVLAAQLPDLVITKGYIYMQGYVANCIDQYQPLVTDVCVRNVGAGAAGTFDVQAGSVAQSIGGLASGEEQCVTLASDAGYATADPGNAVAEEDEGNNSVSIPVPSPPLLCTPVPVVRYLFGLDAASKIGTYDLAEGLHMSADELIWMIYLRQDVKMADGSAFTAWTVKAAWDAIPSWENPGYVTEVTLPDEYTIEFVLWQYDAAVLEALARLQFSTLP